MNNKILKHVIRLQWSTNKINTGICGLCANVLFHFTMQIINKLLPMLSVILGLQRQSATYM